MGTAYAHLLLGLVFGISFFIIGLFFSIVTGEWLNCMQAGLIMGAVNMLCGLILFWITKWGAKRGN